MIILKHVEYKIKDLNELEKLLHHLRETTSKVEGVEFKNIYFPKGKDEFVLVMICGDEDRYLEWRKICPPPRGAKDWYEVLLTEDEFFPKVKNLSNIKLDPEATERTKIIFEEACSVENMEGKFGKTLTKEENNIKNFILSRTPVLGRIPSVIQKDSCHVRY